MKYTNQSQMRRLINSAVQESGKTSYEKPIEKKIGEILLTI